ncbi:MAG: type II toxin-antitoxin system RelE/ParE family toxin [Steroidobacteraceae bacterium]
MARFFATGSKAGIRAPHTERLRVILATLNAAAAPGDSGLPALRLHPLKGSRGGTWSVSVSGNWRITFRFEGKDAVEVDYEDYHCGSHEDA